MISENNHFTNKRWAGILACMPSDFTANSRAHAFAAGFTDLPLRAFQTQIEALRDLVHAWIGLYAPRIAPSDVVVEMAPYRYRLNGSQGIGRRRRS